MNGSDGGPVRQVRNEFRCASCGYVIRGVAVDALCPECGTPVLHSVGGAKPTSGSAIAALVLGIVSILGCTAYGVPSLVCGPLAIYFAVRARKQIAAGTVGPNSAGLATAGLVCGIIGSTLAALVLLALLAMFAGLAIP